MELMQSLLIKLLLFQFGTDSLFTTPIARQAFLQSKYTDVYFYQFSYEGKLGDLIVNQTVKGKITLVHFKVLNASYLMEIKHCSV